MGTAMGAQKARAVRSHRAEVHAADFAKCRVLTTGIDTLNLSTRAPLKAALVAELVELKEQAIATRRGLQAGQQKANLPVWRSKAMGVDFEVQPRGAGKGSLRLTSELVVVVLNADGPRNLPRAYVELKAPFLWSGWERAGDIAVELLKELVQEGAEVEAQVSRLDLACDFAGWQPSPELLERFVGRVLNRNEEHVDEDEPPHQHHTQVHHQGRRFTGFSFGGSSMRCRLYNKSVEIVRSGKAWFEPLWQKEGSWKSAEESGDVWRLEFQLRRSALAQCELVIPSEGSTEMKSWAEVKRGLDALWAHLTREWLTYRLPRSNKERCRLHPRWETLSRARFAPPAPNASVLRHHRRIALERCTGALAGYAMREVALDWEARKQMPSKERFEKDLQRVISFAVSHYEARHEKSMFEASRAQWRQTTNFKAMFTREARA
jgi:hypothetical protein